MGATRRTAAAVALVAVVAAGCGGSGTDGAAPAPASTGQAAAPAPVPPAKGDVETDAQAFRAYMAAITSAGETARSAGIGDAAALARLDVAIGKLGPGVSAGDLKAALSSAAVQVGRTHASYASVTPPPRVAEPHTAYNAAYGERAQFLDSLAQQIPAGAEATDEPVREVVRRYLDSGADLGRDVASTGRVWTAAVSAEATRVGEPDPFPAAPGGGHDQQQQDLFSA